MKIIFIDWKCFGRKDILDVLKQLGHSVVLYPAGVTKEEASFHTEYIDKLSGEISKQNIQLIFSMNYSPSVSEACNRKGIPYISWIYDNPHLKLYCINIINECNHIFTFNRYTYLDLMKKGVKTIYYAPMAVNVKRLDQLYLSDSDRLDYGSDLSFVGALYDGKAEFHQKILEELKQSGRERTAGYLDGISNAQLNIYGTNFLKDCLNKNIITDITEFFPFEDSEFFHFTDVMYIYSSYILSRRVTKLERKRMLTSLSQHFKTSVFTYNVNAVLGKCQLHERTEPYDITPKVFKASKINLNITLRSIETGIPLRAFEVMGAGGFLISNYQEDFLLHFEPEKDFVFYESEEDLIEKCRFYLDHDSLRKKIAVSGYEKVAKDHTFEKRIKEMIHIAIKIKRNGRTSF